MNCKNCDAVAEGNFCAACGQNTHVHRITIGHILHEFTHAITHADKGFLLLIKDLFSRPGFVVKEYLEGKRKKYFNPISFLVITTAAAALIAYKSGYYEALNRPNEARATWNKYVAEVMEISVNYGKLLGLILITPLFAILSRLLFWKPRYNLAEHFVFQSYMMGMFYIVTSLVSVPLFLLLPKQYANINNLMLHVVFALYLGVAYHQFFQKNIFITMLKSLLMVILFIVFFWLLLIAYVVLKNLIFGH